MFLKRESSGSVQWLIVGLGNPGSKYEKTRHNVGFLTVDELADRKNLPIQKLRFRALTNTAQMGDHKVLLMKPTTYMNLSGQSVGEAARFYKIPPDRIIVISDDVDLPVGRLRVRRRGSAGGHNGLKSLIQHLGSEDFPRIKIGVGGKPHPDYDMADWVLGRFTDGDQKRINQAVEAAADAVTLYLSQGPEEAMSRYNSFEANRE
ncbi:MAG: aminoacyl-tRNA hydrolase [Firmicutes bacterium]|nr:aminoacyl-tRNA hydrolase [Bacillota bacterium]